MIAGSPQRLAAFERRISEAIGALTPAERACFEGGDTSERKALIARMIDHHLHVKCLSPASDLAGVIGRRQTRDPKRFFGCRSSR